MRQIKIVDTHIEDALYGTHIFCPVKPGNLTCSIQCAWFWANHIKIEGVETICYNCGNKNIGDAFKENETNNS